jgi:hypothetical protein
MRLKELGRKNLNRIVAQSSHISVVVVGKAVLTLYPPLRPLSHNVNPRDGAQDINGFVSIVDRDANQTPMSTDMTLAPPASLSR